MTIGATHYTDLDEMTSGLQRADLIIIAARPSMGKTALAMNIAENAAIEDNKTVGMFSLEMSREALLLRLLCSKAKVDSHRMRTGSLWREDMDKVVHAMEQLAHAPILPRASRRQIAAAATEKGLRASCSTMGPRFVGIRLLIPLGPDCYLYPGGFYNYSPNFYLLPISY